MGVAQITALARPRRRLLRLTPPPPPTPPRKGEQGEGSRRAEAPRGARLGHHPKIKQRREGAERRATCHAVVQRRTGRPASRAAAIWRRLRNRAPVAGGPQPLAGSVPLRVLGSAASLAGRRLAQNPSRALRRSTARPRHSAGRAVIAPKAQARTPGLPRPAADVPGRKAPVLPAAGAAPPPHGRPVRTRLPARGRTRGVEHGQGGMSRNLFR